MIKFKYLVIGNNAAGSGLSYTDNSEIDSKNIEIFDANFIKEISSKEDFDQNTFYLITNDNYLCLHEKYIKKVLCLNESELTIFSTFDSKSNNIDSAIGVDPDLGLGRVLVNEKKLRELILSTLNISNRNWYSQYILISLLIDGVGLFVPKCISVRISTNRNFSNLSLDARNLIKDIINIGINNDIYKVLLLKCIKIISPTFTSRDIGLILDNFNLYDTIAKKFHGMILPIGDYYISSEKYLQLSQAVKFQMLKLSKVNI